MSAEKHNIITNNYHKEYKLDFYDLTMEEIKALQQGSVVYSQFAKIQTLGTVKSYAIDYQKAIIDPAYQAKHQPKAQDNEELAPFKAEKKPQQETANAITFTEKFFTELFKKFNEKFSFQLGDNKVSIKTIMDLFHAIEKDDEIPIFEKAFYYCCLHRIAVKHGFYEDPALQELEDKQTLFNV